MVFHAPILLGKAECLDGNKQVKYLILWRRAEEWAKMIQSWFHSHHLSGSICTVYEILHGDDSVNEGKHGALVGLAHIRSGLRLWPPSLMWYVMPWP